MSSALILDGISKSFGGIHALSKVSFTLKTGGIHALIGPNGAGKTTLVSTISGALTPDTGTVRLGERLLNGLSVHERSRLGLVHLIETRLRGDVPILLIEHDMEAVFNLADDITVLVNGEVLKSGTPDEVRASSEVQAAYLSEDDDF